MQQPEQTSQTTTTTDDWSALRLAVTNLNTPSELLFQKVEPEYPGDPGYRFTKRAKENMHTVITLVPKLIDAYADLWELSIALTKAVEQWKNEGQGGKLLVADEQEVRQFN